MKAKDLTQGQKLAFDAKLVALGLPISRHNALSPIRVDSGSRAAVFHRRPTTSAAGASQPNGTEASKCPLNPYLRQDRRVERGGAKRCMRSQMKRGEAGISCTEEARPDSFIRFGAALDETNEKFWRLPPTTKALEVWLMGREA
jgi:hypothetical protein